MRNNGNSTYSICYRSTVPANSPSNSTIRCDFLSPLGALVAVVHNYVTFRNIEVRGHTAATQGRSMLIHSVSNTILDKMRFYRNEGGVGVAAVRAPVNDMVWRDTDMVYCSGNGPHISPGVGLNRFLVEGGNYSYSGGATYNGTGFTPSDGDGIGIGQSGGTASDVVFRNVTFNHNANYGVFSGTTAPYSMTNFSLLGATMIGNKRGCFSEGNDAEIAGTLTISGFLCKDSQGGAPAAGAFHFSANPPAPRTVILKDGIIIGSKNRYRVDFGPNVNNNYQFRNIIFAANPGDPRSDYGDIYSRGADLIGNEIFSDIYFYSLPHQNRRFSRLNAANTPYLYNKSSDLDAWVAVTHGTRIFLNVDPFPPPSLPTNLYVR